MPPHRIETVKTRIICCVSNATKVKMVLVGGFPAASRRVPFSSEEVILLSLDMKSLIGCAMSAAKKRYYQMNGTREIHVFMCPCAESQSRCCHSGKSKTQGIPMRYPQDLGMGILGINGPAVSVELPAANQQCVVLEEILGYRSQLPAGRHAGFACKNCKNRPLSLPQPPIFWTLKSICCRLYPFEKGIRSYTQHNCS